VAPSANRSGHVSPTTADHVLVDLGERIDLVLDGGPARVGVESTIVACLDDAVTLLRPGGLPRTAIERALRRPVQEATMVADEGEAPLAPGMLASHYAPRAAVRLDADAVHPGEALLAFGATLPPGAERAATVLNLSARGDLIEAAANLFSHLRELDRAGASAIAVMPVPHEGLGEAINDRLMRAAAPRQ
jgi:L-threonylcarbamoyladenylate synthase